MTTCSIASAAVFGYGLKVLWPNDAPAEKKTNGRTEKIVPPVTPITLIDFQIHQLVVLFSLL
jgi:hypothetical protein